MDTTGTSSGGFPYVFWFLFSCTGSLNSQSQWFFSSTGSAAHSMCSVSQKAARQGPTIANRPGTKTRNTEAHWQPQHWLVANHPVKTFQLQAFCLPQSPHTITVTKKNLEQQLHSCEIKVLGGLIHESLMMYETFLYCRVMLSMTEIRHWTIKLNLCAMSP